MQEINIRIYDLRAETQSATTYNFKNKLEKP